MGMSQELAQDVGYRVLAFEERFAQWESQLQAMRDLATQIRQTDLDTNKLTDPEECPPFRDRVAALRVEWIAASQDMPWRYLGPGEKTSRAG